MRRSGFALAAIALAALLTVIYFMAQRPTYAESGLVLQQKFPDHAYAVYTADFDEKEELVASGGEDGLRLWRVDNGSEVYHRPGRIYLARFLKDGNFLCADANEGVLLLDRKTWQVQRKFGQKAVRIVAAVSDSGDKIAASFSVARKDDKVPPMSTEIHVWQLVNGEWNESIMRGHVGAVFALSWHPTVPHLISRGEDTTLRVWDIVSGRQIDIRGNPLVLPVHHVPELWAACGVSSNGNRLFAGKTVLGYRERNETPVEKDNEIDLGGKDLDPVRSAMFSPDEHWIATGHKDGTLRLWDGKSFMERAVVKGSINGSELNEVRFSRSGKLIVTAGEGIVPAFDAIQKKVKSNDTVVRVWRVNIPE